MEKSGKDHKESDLRPGINWQSSKVEQWDLLSSKLDEAPRGRQVAFPRKTIVYSIAASILLVVSFFSIALLYTQEYSTGNDQNLSMELPDGSVVNMNDGSTLSYKPLLWWLKRDVSLTGEAYFEVEHGSNFAVNSANGTTEVLGTKFNVYSRGNAYRVTCLEGAVRVTSPTGEATEIKPNEKVEIKGDEMKVISIEKAENDVQWMSNTFVFTSVELNEVLEELSRQFNVKLSYEGDPLYYSGNFSREYSVERIVNILSRSFNLDVVEVSPSEYVLKMK